MTISEITKKEEWDRGVALFKYTTMFDSWEWAEFEKIIGNKFETFGIYDEQKLIGLLPIKTVAAKRGKYLHVRHGPLIDWHDAETVKHTVDYLARKAKEEVAPFVRISPLLPNAYGEKLRTLGFKKSPTHANDAELTVYVDLTKDEQEILMGMRKNTRNLIRKAEKLGIRVKVSNGTQLFDDFAVAYLDTVSRHKWTAYALEYIKKEFELFATDGKADLFVAYYQDKPISASIFIRHANQVIYHHSGSLSEFRGVPAAYLLHWEAIKFFKAAGLEIYNFWGVSPKDKVDHPWYGLSLFKRGFTQTEREFIHAHDLILNPLAYLTRTYELFETWRRGYL